MSNVRPTPVLKETFKTMVTPCEQIRILHKGLLNSTKCMHLGCFVKGYGIPLFVSFLKKKKPLLFFSESVGHFHDGNDALMKMAY